MKVTFEKGQMIIEHPGGHIDKYAKQDLLLQKELEQQIQNEVVGRINNLNATIINIERSKNG